VRPAGGLHSLPGRETVLEFVLHIHVVLLNVGQGIARWKHADTLRILFPSGSVWLIRDIVERGEPVNLVPSWCTGLGSESAKIGAFSM